MKALITGCTGQDGSYLCELLLEKGYEEIGIDVHTGKTVVIIDPKYYRPAEVDDDQTILLMNYLRNKNLYELHYIDTIVSGWFVMFNKFNEVNK